MLRAAFFTLLLLVLNVGAVTGQPVTGAPDDSLRQAEVVATIDGHDLTVGDFERTYVQLLSRTGQEDTPWLRRQHLDHLIDTYLLGEAARQHGLEADPEHEAYLMRAWKTVLGHRYYETALVETLPPITEAELRAAYARTQEQVVVRHLFYQHPDGAAAAYARLQDGRSFLEEAMACYDLPAIDSTAGLMGAVRYFSVDDAFAEAAFALPVGAYSEPVRTRAGWHIIRVEDRLRAPLLTEDGFAARREGVASQLRQRRLRLEGDRFVRAFMDDLQVDVRPDGLAALTAALDALTPADPVATTAGAMPAAPEIAAADLDTLAGRLTPATALATFTLEGHSYTFTAGDYYTWLPGLPQQEALNNPAASLGRALRNEALALAGLGRGLEAEAAVQREVEQRGRFHLAALVRTYLYAAPSPLLLPLYAEAALLKTLRAQAEITIHDPAARQVVLAASSR